MRRNPPPASRRANGRGGSASRSGSARDPLTDSYGTRQQIETTIDVLFRRRWIILACLLVSVLIATALVLTRPQNYEARALVLVDMDRMPGGEEAEVAGSTPFVRSERSIATEVFVLQNSYSLAQRVNERLSETAGANPNGEVAARRLVEFEPANRSIASAIVVRVTSPDPTDAAIVANAYADEYVTQTREASQTYLAASRAFLEEQEVVRGAELREAEDAVRRHQQRGGSVALSPESSTLVTRMVGMQTSRDEAMIDLQMRQSQIRALERELEQVNPQLARRMASGLDNQLDALRQELGNLETERRQIMAFEARRDQDRSAQRLAPIERRIAAIEAEMQQLTERYLDEVMAVGGMDASTEAIAHAADLKRRSVQERIALEGLEARVTTMNQRLDAYRSELSTIPALSTELARLERDRQLAERMYAHVVTRLQDTRIQEASEPGYARILRHAEVPAPPVGIEPWRMILIGLLLGLFGGVAIAVTRDRLDTRVYKPDQLRRSGLGVLGVVPNLGRYIREAHDGAASVERAGSLVSTTLVTLTDPMSGVAETFRHLRAALQFGGDGQAAKTIVVTSSSQADGKSTVTANLAVAMAQSEQRVLLIDADLRRPRIHKMFGTANAYGLAQLLMSGDGDRHPALDANLAGFRSTQHPNLFVLPTGMFGSRGVNPAEVFGSKRMRDLLAACRERFDAIVIDTPPVLVASDAVVLSALSDSVVVVARAAASKEGDLEQTLSMLEDVSAPVAGLVLNDFDLSLAYGYRYTHDRYSKNSPYARHDHGPPTGDGGPLVS